VFYLIRFIPFFFCFFSLPFPLFFSLSSLSSLLPHTNSNQQPSAERTEDRAPSAAPSMASLLPLYAASNAFPLPPPCSQQHVPPIPLLPPPPLPSPASSPWPAMELSSLAMAASHGEAQPSSFFSWDNQNRYTRPSTCYPHSQFYLKLTLISEFCGILFFNQIRILCLIRILILPDSSHTPI
jgi:hypothetical protein